MESHESPQAGTALSSAGQRDLLILISGLCVITRLGQNPETPKEINILFPTTKASSQPLSHDGHKLHQHHLRMNHHVFTSVERSELIPAGTELKIGEASDLVVAVDSLGKLAPLKRIYPHLPDPTHSNRFEGLDNNALTAQITIVSGAVRAIEVKREGTWDFGGYQNTLAGELLVKLKYTGDYLPLFVKRGGKFSSMFIDNRYNVVTFRNDSSFVTGGTLYHFESLEKFGNAVQWKEGYTRNIPKRATVAKVNPLPKVGEFVPLSTASAFCPPSGHL